MSRPVAIGALCVLLVGCPRNDGRSPTETAIDKSTQRVYDSVRTGARSSSGQGPFTVPVRFNPADCECPEFEVFAYGRWIRAFIDANAAASTKLEQLRDGDSLKRVELRGRLAEDLREAESRVRYPVFKTE